MSPCRLINIAIIGIAIPQRESLRPEGFIYWKPRFQSSVHRESVKGGRHTLPLTDDRHLKTDN